MKIQQISFEAFKKRFQAPVCDPWHTAVFTQDDIELHKAHAGILPPAKRAIQILTAIPNLIKHPFKLLKNFSSYLKTQRQSIRVYSVTKHILDITKHPFADHTFKSSVIAAFKPKRLLEIGTGYGWGIVAFKSVLPDCECYTMSPQLHEETGMLVSQKNLGIHMIWADSLTYDFSKLPHMDVTYIDGDHTYRYVLADLFNSLMKTTRAIVLDDYIPDRDTTHGGVYVYAPFHDEVRNAVADFLKYAPHAVKEAFWIKNTRICVLVLNHKDA